MSKAKESPMILAEKDLAEANKLAKKGLFKTPQYMDAAVKYCDAAKSFTLEGQHVRAAECWELASECAGHEEMDLNTAVYQRDAGVAYSKALKNGADNVLGKLVKAQQKAGELFQRAGRFLDAARCYLMAATFVQNAVEKTKLMQEATDLFEVEKKPFQAAASLMELMEEMVGEEMYKEAIVIGERVAAMYRKLQGYGHKIDTVALISVVCAIKIEDCVVAEQLLDKFENFSSDAFVMAENLVKAYKARDGAAFEAAKNDQAGKLGLANQVLFLIRDLVLPDAVEGAEML